MNRLCSTSRHSRNPPPSCHPPQHNFQQISKNSHHPLPHPDGTIFQRQHPETAGGQTQSGPKCLLRFPAYKCNLCSTRRSLSSSRVESTRFTSYHVRAHLFARFFGSTWLPRKQNNSNPESVCQGHQRASDSFITRT